MPGPYDGLQVIDLAEAMPGSYAGMILAELGADVVKVEPSTGNPLRGRADFHVFNRSKRSLVADLDSRDGRQFVLDVLTGADVSIVDFVPTEARHFALEYALLAERYPRLIHCEMPPMGSEGPLANTPRCEDLVLAHSSLPSLQPATREGPVYHVLPISSYGAAFLAVGAIGAALYVRERTGRGQRVEVSWLAGAMAIAAMHIMRPEDDPEFPWDNDPYGVTPSYRIYQCSDGKWLSVSCNNLTDHAKLCLALDAPELLSDPRFQDAPFVAREHRPLLQAMIADLFKTRAREEWLRKLREGDAPCAPVLTRDEVIHDQQLIHNGMLKEIDDPVLGRTTQFAPPLHMSRTPPKIKGAAPNLGERGTEVHAERWPIGLPGCPAAMPDLPLAGVHVLELGRYVAGPVAGKILADMGADVVKVEPLTGDKLRVYAYGFAGVNRCKRSIAMDIFGSEGRALLHDLVRGADVLIDNWRAGFSERFGLDYESLRQVNPRIIHFSATSWGDSGPYAARPGYDSLVGALTGYMCAQGGNGQPPVHHRIGIFDHSTGLTGAYGVLAALYHRERTGEGQHVEAAILDVALAVQGARFILYDGKPADPDGGPDLLGLSALRRLYRTRDGWLMVVADERPEHWPALAQVAGRPDLVDHYPTAQAPIEVRDGELAFELEQAFAERPRGEWLNALCGAGVPAAAALTLSEMYRDPQIIANGFFRLVEQPSWGKLWQAVRLVKFSGCPGIVERRAPLNGEHTEEILRELGLCAERIAQLRERGVVGAIDGLE